MFKLTINSYPLETYVAFHGLAHHNNNNNNNNNNYNNNDDNDVL